MKLDRAEVLVLRHIVVCFYLFLSFLGSFSVRTQIYKPSIYKVSATWRNDTGDQTWTDVRANVVQLTNGARLIGSTFDLTEYNKVAPGEILKATFRLQLANCSPFRFFISLLGFTGK